ncbi:MAG TPA: phosphatidylglycerophosphatase A [Myxococcota bacterium]|nr:phosphatidylglycerophosphatase A [Myxococcota bacterium]
MAADARGWFITPSSGRPRGRPRPAPLIGARPARLEPSGIRIRAAFPAFSGVGCLRRAAPAGRVAIPSLRRCAPPPGSPRRQPLLRSRRLEPSLQRDRSPATAAPPRLAFWIATAGGVGLVPGAPGTAGAALASALFVLLSPLERGTAAVVLGVAAAVLFAAGVWAGGQVVAASGVEDDQRIVIDEVVGQLVTLAPLLAWPGWSLRGAGGWLAVVTGFVAFRVFDVWKPGPVRIADERVGGGFGVMLDDLVAGVLGAAALVAGLALAAAVRGAEPA